MDHRKLQRALQGISNAREALVLNDGDPDNIPGHMLGPRVKLNPEALAIVREWEESTRELRKQGEAASEKVKKLRQAFEMSKAETSTKLEEVQPEMRDGCGYALDVERGEFRVYQHIHKEDEEKAETDATDIINRVSKKDLH